MKKKGFTLIELLAVIVILAIIALITVPILMGIIEKAKKSAFEDHVYGIMDAAHLYYADNLLKLEETGPLEFNCNGEVCEADNGQKLKFKGNVPKSGKIILNSSNVEVFEITDGKYCASGNDKNLKISTDCITPSLEYITDGNIVRYDFDDSNNTSSALYDLSGNNKNGTISGPVITDKGIFFDGNDHVKIGAINNPQITWEVSFSVQSYGHYHVLSNMETGGCGIYTDSGDIYGQCYMGGAYHYLKSNQKIELNKNYTASITYDGSDFKLYLNGELQESYESGSGLKNPISSTIVLVGANPLGSNPESAYFKGFINFVRIYNRALSEGEIINNYKVDRSKVKIIERDVSIVNKKFDDFIKDGLQLNYSILSNTGAGYVSSSRYFVDLSGNSPEGVLHGPVFNEDGAYFDGSNDYISVGQLNNPQITWETTFSISSYKGQIISNMESGGCGIYVSENHIIGQCYIGGSYRKLNTRDVELNKVYTVAITYDGADFKLYLNGELQESYSIVSTIKNPTNSTILMFGANPNKSSPAAPYFNGTIKSARVYNKALTDDEIKSNYSYDKKLYPN